MERSVNNPNSGSFPSPPAVGIDRMSFAVPSHVLSLRDLAEARGTPYRKYEVGLGQEQMAVPAPDEDIVTLAATAGAQVLDGEDTGDLDTVILATESGVDQSKAGAIYVHGLLGLPSRCRAFEVKQACCSSTAALQMALASVALRPHRRFLVLATDVARYGLGSAGEPTQGAGAIAMLVSARPRLLALDPESGSYTEDVMDFWRPNYLDAALVDGKYSIRVYLNALEQAWAEYRRESGRAIGDFARFAYHLPFTRMGEKAHAHLSEITGAGLDRAARHRQIEAGLRHNRRIGNTYTASLHLSLLSLLEHDPEDLAGQRVGLFSYGSGCMGTFLSGVVQPGYRDALLGPQHARQLDQRRRIDLATYETWYQHHLPHDGSDFRTARHTMAPFRLAGIRDHQRLYEPNAPARTVPAPAPEAELAPA